MFKCNSVTAIIVAAGSSNRMGFDKLNYRIDKQTVLEKSISAFARHPLVDNLIIVCSKERSEQLDNEIFCEKPFKYVQGADERYLSVQKGVACAIGDIIAIHDAARPFVSEKIISAAIATAFETGAAAPAVAVKDTIKTSQSGIITSTPPRSTLFAVQTPQVFNRSLYISALKQLPENVEITDDCRVMELAGYAVALTVGEYENYKITTPDDLKEDKQMRIGHGYDVHRFCEARKLILGGVDIPFEKGLLGHSDADVLVHAIMDAMLGAAALGDIGLYFPDTDEKFKGANSIELLKHVSSIISQKGYTPENIDATILCQAPKLRLHIDAMRENISKALDIDISSINVKATTEEGLGFTGAKEGIAAHAVVLLR